MLRIACLAAALAGMFALSGCTDPVAPAPPPPRPIVEGTALRFPAGHPQLSSLGTAEASAPKPIAIEMPARVVWNEDRTQRLYPAFSGKVSRILTDVGSRVTAGQALIELASPEFGLAQADASRARTDLAQAQRQLDRIRDLHSIGVAARKELEQAQADSQRAQAELDRAQARIALYGGGDAINQKLALTAGISGVVVERNLNPGQEIRPEQFGPGSAALMVLTDPEQLWLQIDVRERDVSLLAPGRKIEFIAHTYPARRFEAVVLATGNAIDPVSRTLKVRAAVANPERLLKLEMIGKVKLDQPQAEGVIITGASVFGQDGAHWVYISTGPGIFEPRKVEIAYLGGGEVLVSKGLRAGDRVVTENTLLLARMYRTAIDTAERSASNAPKAASR